MTSNQKWPDWQSYCFLSTCISNNRRNHSGVPLPTRERTLTKMESAIARIPPEKQMGNSINPKFSRPSLTCTCQKTKLIYHVRKSHGDLKLKYYARHAWQDGHSFLELILVQIDYKSWCYSEQLPRSSTPLSSIGDTCLPSSHLRSRGGHNQ